MRPRSAGHRKFASKLAKPAAELDTSPDSAYNGEEKANVLKNRMHRSGNEKGKGKKWEVGHPRVNKGA